jgi:hypothetical protein
MGFHMSMGCTMNVVVETLVLVLGEHHPLVPKSFLRAIVSGLVFAAPSLFGTVVPASEAVSHSGQ